MIHFTAPFQKAVNMIAERINNRKKVAKIAIQKAILTYLKQKCINKYMMDNNISFRDMIFGDNTLASRVIALRNKIMTDRTGKYVDYITNGVLTNNLLANLSRIPYETPYGQEHYDVLGLDNVDGDDAEIKDNYIDDWQ